MSHRIETPLDDLESTSEEDDFVIAEPEDLVIPPSDPDSDKSECDFREWPGEKNESECSIFFLNSF